MKEWPVFGIQYMGLFNHSSDQHLWNPLYVKKHLCSGETGMFSACVMELRVYTRLCWQDSPLELDHSSFVEGCLLHWRMFAASLASVHQRHVICLPCAERTTKSIVRHCQMSARGRNHFRLITTGSGKDTDVTVYADMHTALNCDQCYGKQ